MTRCPTCGSATVAFGSSLVRGAHRADYHRCVECGSVHVSDPHWLDDSYGDPIDAADVGIVDRNLRLSALTARLLRARRLRRGTFLDFGGGSGLFVRLMRDRGFDFRYYDEHPRNLFARDFEVEQLDQRYDLVTAFEVLEHLTEPRAVLTELLGVTDSILLSTQILPEPPPRPGEWWYYAPETVKHVTFATADGLRRLATSVGCRVVSAGDVHLFTRGRRAPWYATLVLRLPRWLVVARASRHSLLRDDHSLHTGTQDTDVT